MIPFKPAFLSTFHSNHRPISQRFRDKRRFPSKIARKSPIFPPPVHLTPRWRGSRWNWVSTQGSEETRMIGLPEGCKSFKIGLAVLIQYRRVIDTQPASQPRCRSIYRADYVRRAGKICAVYPSIYLSISLSTFRFNGHFSRWSWLAYTRMSPFWILLELRIMELTTGTNKTLIVK